MTRRRVRFVGELRFGRAGSDSLVVRSEHFLEGVAPGFLERRPED